MRFFLKAIAIVYPADFHLLLNSRRIIHAINNTCNWQHSVLYIATHSPLKDMEASSKLFICLEIFLAHI